MINTIVGTAWRMVSVRSAMRIAIAIILLIISSCSKHVAEHGPSPQQPQGFASVPPADRSRVDSVRTVEEWKNAFLVIRREGVEMITSTGSTGVNSVSVDRMRDILLSLPADAWPFGRIVAVSEISIRSGNDTELIKENRKALESMLAGLDIQINWWP